MAVEAPPEGIVITREAKMRQPLGRVPYSPLVLLAAFLALLLSACGGTGRADAPTVAATATSLPSPSATSLPDAEETAVATATSVPTATPTASATPAPPTVTATPAPTATPTPVTFAVIGDYGLAGPAEEAVATLVHGWEPDFIITTGDNNYPNGEAATIDENVGQYYAEYIYPYTGAYTRTTSVTHNRFFPSLGNHDYYSLNGAQPYLDYFTLPGNERYYDFEWGPVHLFAVNSDYNEPDGIRADSAQGVWLRDGLAASTAPWRLVYMHAAPFSSARHGSYPVMQWPYAEWGATAVLAGHDHVYERLLIDGIPYFVNGLGGSPAVYGFEESVPGSQVRFNGDHGAMLVEATAEEIAFRFVTHTGEVIDTFTLSVNGTSAYLPSFRATAAR